MRSRRISAAVFWCAPKSFVRFEPAVKIRRFAQLVARLDLLLVAASAGIGGLGACAGGCEKSPSPSEPRDAALTLADAGAGATAPLAVLDAGGDAADAMPPRPRVPGCKVTPPSRSYRGSIKRPEGDRAYEVRLPPTDGPEPARVLFAIHPFGSTALEFLNATHLADVFGAAGWVTIAPEGINRSFNGGDCCGEAVRAKLDDVGLFLAIVDDLREHACIEDERLYLTGFSNGGFMSQAFACRHPERVGAIASVGAVLGVRPCEPKEPVSVLLVNGIGDNVIPPDGGGPFRTRPLSETLETWRDAGGCEPRFGDAGISKSIVGAACRTEPCQAGRTLEVCSVPYAHVWMVRSHPAGDVASARQTAREMLEFFETYGVRP
jgi:polyhydroxybutyrate depolymerase